MLYVAAGIQHTWEPNKQCLRTCVSKAKLLTMPSFYEQIYVQMLLHIISAKLRKHDNTGRILAYHSYTQNQHVRDLTQILISRPAHNLSQYGAGR